MQPSTLLELSLAQAACAWQMGDVWQKGTATWTEAHCCWNRWQTRVPEKAPIIVTAQVLVNIFGSEPLKPPGNP